jgi:hypothetical protein
MIAGVYVRYVSHPVGVGLDQRADLRIAVRRKRHDETAREGEVVARDEGAFRLDPGQLFVDRRAGVRRHRASATLKPVTASARATATMARMCMRSLRVPLGDMDERMHGNGYGGLSLSSR